jgi:hypothetical protein
MGRLMGVLHASAITAATIRVVGQVPTDICVSHLGTTEQEASLRIGELLIYLSDPHIAHQVAELWAQAKASTSALPNVIGARRANLPARVGLVGVIVRLGGDPQCGTTWIPGQPESVHPAHVRVEVGPIKWEVCDRAAWHSIGRAWALLDRHLTAT